MKPRLLLALAVVAVLAMAGWFFIGPLLVDNTVNEAFDPGQYSAPPTPADALDEKQPGQDWQCCDLARAF